MILGGNQERKLRGGTENGPGIVGMGIAAEIALRDRVDVERHVKALRDMLEEKILQTISIAEVNARDADRLCNTSNISFKGLEAEAVLILLSDVGICASAGAACSSGSLEPSHVLTAMGLPVDRSHGAVRFSLSRFNTGGEVERVVSVLPGLLSRLTKLSSSPLVG
jgi:cysteine desulfurase